MGGVIRRKDPLLRRASVLAVAACFSGAGLANPVSPNVVSGQATFAQFGKTLTVTNSPSAIINWGGFSIKADEATRFVQQSSSSSVLNRVVGQDPSVILGQLQSNGRVFLINPSGIVFGAGAQIDVAGLVASSLDLSNADFVAGRFKFQSGPIAGTVSNQGEIRTPDGGKVWLIAPKVENSGLITSPQGEIILAAGRKIEIMDTRNVNVRMEVEAPDDQALNVGQLVAKSGAAGMVGRTVRTSGVINANAAVVDENGKIFFRRSDSATAVAATDKAGTIVLRASDTVNVESGARVTADGPVAGKVSVNAGENISLQL